MLAAVGAEHVGTALVRVGRLDPDVWAGGGQRRRHQPNRSALARRDSSGVVMAVPIGLPTLTAHANPPRASGSDRVIPAETATRRAGLPWTPGAAGAARRNRRHPPAATVALHLCASDRRLSARGPAAALNQPAKPVVTTGTPASVTRRARPGAWSRGRRAPYDRMKASSSSRFASIFSRESASRFRRSRGSVLEARTLKCQSS